MKSLKIVWLPVGLLLLLNGCGLSLDVQKRVHRPGFYVNVSHEKQHIRVDGEKEGERAVKAEKNDSASLQKVKRSTYKDFEIKTSQPRIKNAPLLNVADSNFSIAHNSSEQTSVEEAQAFFMLEEARKAMKAYQNAAQASADLGMGAPASPMTFSFNLMNLIEIGLLVVLIYMLGYLFMLLFFSVMFSSLNSSFLMIYLLVILFVVLLYAVVSSTSSSGFY